MFYRGSAAALLCAFLFFRIILFSAAQSGPASAPQGQSGAAAPAADLHPVLVEMFTSEGCSSCPPADVMLARMDAGQPIPGAQLIVLSEHVTYWDHDGWKDPNSSALLTERQSSYEQNLGHAEPFTPQMIVDGATEPHLTSPQEIGDALRKAAAQPKVPVRISNVTVDPENPAILRARIETDANFDNHNAEVYVAVALDHYESQVLKGENGGKHLVFVAVVQGFQKIGKLSKGNSFAQDVQLKLKPGADPKNLRLIAFVQEPGQHKLLGAALHKPAI